VGHSAAVAWNYKDINLDSNTPEGAEAFERPNLTVSGVMGWLTGQKHKPIDDKKFKITVYFNHDCLKYNPSHEYVFQLLGLVAKRSLFP